MSLVPLPEDPVGIRGWMPDSSPYRHSCAYSHASLMLQTGESIVMVSKKLGHANVSNVSDIYAHELPGLRSRRRTPSTQR